VRATVCVLTVVCVGLSGLVAVAGEEALKNAPPTDLSIRQRPVLPNPNRGPSGMVTGTLQPVFKPVLDSNAPPVRTKSERVSCACPAGFYETGDRVVAAVDNPQGAEGIVAGQQGTVICGAPSGFPILLVSWDGWGSGHNGNGYCECPVVSLPDSSGWYVDCGDLLPSTGQAADCVCDSQYFVGTRVAATVDNPHGAPGIEAGTPGTVVCGAPGSPELLVAWDNWTQGHDGNGICQCPNTTLADHSAWWVDCAEATIRSEVNCQCGGYFTAGQRIRALVDNPSGAAGILTGHQGTVVSGAVSGISPVLLISWDGWTDGHNGNGYCGCPVTSLPDTSGWYVDCDEVGGCPDDWWETRGYGGTDDTCYGPYLGSPGEQDHLHCDEDWVYVVRAVAGVTYTIETANLVGGADTVIELYDDCSTFIASDDDSGGGLASRLVVTAGADQFWDLRIREFADSYASGEGYTLRVTDSTVLFFDGFETGNATTWTSTEP
jgi:hypothetical protein